MFKLNEYWDGGVQSIGLFSKGVILGKHPFFGFSIAFGEQEMRGLQELRALSFLLLGVLCSATIHAKTFVLFTVDVESFSKGNPEAQIWGRLQGVEGEWGITKIMDILESNDAKGTFYLNVYEQEVHGELPIRLAAMAIDDRNHDLQLHTHPGPRYGVPAMSNAQPELQLAILLDGINLIRAWTGKTVIAHRAGAYKANLDTVRAVKDSGLLVDSSLAKGSPLASVGLLKNSVSRMEGVTEFPVSHYNQVSFGGWESKRHIDIEGSTLNELVEILKQASENGLCSVNIMMHSFSLSRYGSPDHGVAKRLDDLLRYINGNGSLEIVTTTTLYDMFKDGKACTKDLDFVPTTGLLLTYFRAVEDFDKGYKNKMVAIGAPSLLIVVVMAVIGCSWYVRAFRRGRKLSR